MSKRPPSTNSPYGKAAQNYAARGVREESSRETEARALLKAAKMLKELQSDWDANSARKIEDTLKFNRQLWVVFYDNAIKDGQSAALSANVVSLSGFIFKRSMEILAAPSPEKLDILISINREVAGGLMARA
jgi:flagellar biosynthesis activator protein FlaF